ncbi:hypothetical protein TrVE_jg9693 [Triparma verrucosa]|uniref:Uncharacterized protein n=1 Tax=Triparma verrucosa TaxID=1606542 RepID=A0A9W7FCG4_9STRA|nr:hypothetical protein TrVE_jg9693 [Triparma verrucosa]
MPPTKKGTLYKQRDVFKGYRPRLFVLDPPILHYYLEASDPAPRKSIFLTGCTITPESWGEDSSSPGMKISHPSTSVTYHLGCRDGRERDEWVEELRKASVETPPTPKARRGGESLGFTTNSSSSSPSPLQNPNPPPPSLPRYISVPPPFVRSLESAFHRMSTLTSSPLPTSPTSSSPWSFLFSKKGVLASTLPGQNLTVRGDAIMPLPPLQVFQTVINVFCKEKYDNQMDTGSRLTTYNPHTFVDYLKFKPVWPTSSRDFVNIVSWKVCEGVITIVAVEFNDDKLCPKIRGNVRGSCLIGGWTIKKHIGEGGEVESKVQIVVSSDLKGGLPSSIVQVVTQQQAMFPVIIGKWIMGQTEGREIEKDLEADVTEENVLKVVEKLPKGLNVKHKFGESEHDGADSSPDLVDEVEESNRPNSPVPPSNNSNSSLRIPSSPNSNSNSNSSPSSRDFGVNVTTAPSLTPTKPSLTFTTFALSLPVLLWAACQTLFPTLYNSRGFMFLLGLVLGLRSFVTRRLGTQMTYKDGTTVGLMGCGNGGTGPVKCSFNVDLKRILRYIERKKGEGESVAVTHIALKALALSLREYSLFNGRKVRLPLLGVEGYYPNLSVDVSTAAGVVANGSSNIVKVEKADQMKINDIAKFINGNNEGKKYGKDKGALLPKFLKKPLEILSEQLDLKVPGLGLSGRRFGTALVVTSPNNEGSEVTISADLLTPYNGKPSGPSIILIVGGVRILPSFSKEPRSAMARPVLTVSVTVGCEVANVASCRVLVERVQELMREPEKMDKM